MESRASWRRRGRWLEKERVKALKAEKAALFPPVRITFVAKVTDIESPRERGFRGVKSGSVYKPATRGSVSFIGPDGEEHTVGYPKGARLYGSTYEFTVTDHGPDRYPSWSPRYTRPIIKEVAR